MKYIFTLLIGLIVASCFDDDSTLDTRRISEISIDTITLKKDYGISEDKIYNLDKNEVFNLDITKYVTQTDKTMPLFYAWDMDYAMISDSSVLHLVGEKLGIFPMRVKVSNEHGSAFFQFSLSVNSPYEEGIIVLSEASDKTSMLSFLRTGSGGTLSGSRDFETHCLTLNNPEIIFPKAPTDVGKRENQLFISFKEEPSIYIVNTKTFEVENTVKAPEYPDFVPERLLLPDNTARTALALCENGKIYNLASMEGIILPHESLTSTYSLAHTCFGEYSLLYYIWDTDFGSLCYYNGYYTSYFQDFGPVWDGDHVPVAMFEDKKDDSFTVLTTLNDVFWKTTLGNNIFLYDEDYNLVGIDIRDQKAVGGSAPLETAPYVGSPLYQELIYAVGNKLYRWYYSDPAFPTAAWAEIDLAGAEITSLALSPDQKQLYVGVCQPGESGLNGSLYVLDSNRGTVVTSYKNIGYKPVKIMYKIK